jgi:hypothetical protein
MTRITETWRRSFVAAFAAFALLVPTACLPFDDASGEGVVTVDGEAYNVNFSAKKSKSPSPSISASESLSPSPSLSESPSPSPSPSPPPKPRIGATAGGGSAFDTLNSAFPSNGKLMSERIYESAIPAVYGGRTATAHNAGRVVWYSTKPDMAAVASGSLDAAINAWLTGFPTTGADFYLTFWHEPEDQIEVGQWGGSQASSIMYWKAGITRLDQLVNARGNSRLHTFINLMGPWTFNPNSPYDTWAWDDGLPWATLDATCADPYYDLLGNQHTSVVMDQHLPGQTRSFMDYVRSHNQPVCLAEYGVENDNSDAVRDDYVRLTWDWAKAQTSPPVVDIMYFWVAPPIVPRNWILDANLTDGVDTPAFARLKAQVVEARQ